MTKTIKGQFRDPQLDVSGKVVGFYPREFFMLDNFSSFQVEIWGRVWPTSEHAYQASHFFDTAPQLAEKIGGRVLRMTRSNSPRRTLIRHRQIGKR